MNKTKPSLVKLFIVDVLSLGFMILGIGCISWAIFSIWVQPYYYANATRSQHFIPTTFTKDQNDLGGDSDTSVKLAHSYANTHTDKTLSTAPLSEDNNEEADISIVPPAPDKTTGVSGNSDIIHDISLVPPAPDKTVYPEYPTKGDYIGSLVIPALTLELPIYQGTSENELKKGVGHFIQSVLPGEEDNSVLSGHRETVFAKIGKLKIGDQLIVQTLAGTFTYEMTGARIVHKDDKTVIVPTDHAVLTLTTCYPFNYIGRAPDRYIVSADLIKSE